MCIAGEIHYNEITYKFLISDILLDIQSSIFPCLVICSMRL